MFLRRICSGRTNIPSMGLLVLFSTSKCMVFISVRHNDRSTADLGFSFDLFVNGCDGNPTNYTLFISGGFYFRKSNRCFIHLSASQSLHWDCVRSWQVGGRPCLPLLRSAGPGSREQAGSQGDQAAVENGEMRPVIGLLPSFCNFYSILLN